MSRVLLALILLAAFSAAALWYAVPSSDELRTAAAAAPMKERAAEEAEFDAGSFAQSEAARERALPLDASPSRATPPESQRSEAIPMLEAELAEAHWVEGRVVFPADTPADEEAWVIADGKRFSDGSRHRARVEADGAFRVAFRKGVRSGELWLHARYLRLDEPLGWKRSDDEAPILLPVLGARIGGRLLVPAGAEADASSGRIQLVTKILSGRSLSSDVDPRQIPVQPDLTFSVEALPAGVICTLRFDGPRWIGESAEIRLRPGQAHMLDLELRAGITLAGCVRDEDGSPLPAAVVRARLDAEKDSDEWPSLSSRSGRTGTDGSFELCGLEPGSIQIEAELQGFVPTRQMLDVLQAGEQRTGLNLVLARGNAIGGRVVWPDGTPAEAHIDVSLEQNSVGLLRANESVASASGTSDGTGLFQITGLGIGPYRVHARATREQGTTTQRMSTSRERGATKQVDWRAIQQDVPVGTRGLELVLSGGLSVSGSVVDDLGQPVADFRVRAERADVSPRAVDFTWEQESFRKTDGNFELVGLQAGAWNVRAWSHEHAECTLRIELPDVTPLRFVLTRAATIRGTVLDANGNPVGGARVRAKYERSGAGRPDNELTSKSSRKDGSFDLTGLPSGEVTLLCESEVAAPSDPLKLVLTTGQELDGVVLTLGRGATILGQVLDGDGRPIRGAMVRLDSRFAQPETNRERRTSTQLETDAEGRFEAHGLSAGGYALRARVGAGLELEQTLMLAEAETKHASLRVPTGGLVRMHGRVRSDLMQECAGDVRAFRAQDEEDNPAASSRGQIADGTYELTLPGPGTYRVEASITKDTGELVLLPGIFWQDTLEVPNAEDFEHDIVVPVGCISGRVTSGDGEALQGISVESEPERHEGGRHGAAWSPVTDFEGRYELFVPPGQYSVVASASAFMHSSDEVPYADARVPGLVVAENEHLRNVDLVLRQGGTLEGSVQWEDGRTAESAELWSLGREAARELGTCRDGKFRIEGVEPGTHWIVATEQAGTTREKLRVDVTAGSSQRLELVLVEATRVHVRGLSSAGAPIGCEIEAVDARGESVLLQRGETGEAWLGPLLPGSYTVRARRDALLVERALTLAGAEPSLELELRFP